MGKVTHFHSGDERFCGSREKFRHFSLIEAEVDCPQCCDLAQELAAQVESPAEAEVEDVE